MLQETTEKKVSGTSVAFGTPLRARLRQVLANVGQPMRLGTQIGVYLTLVLVVTLSFYALNTLRQRRLSLIEHMKDETLTVGTALAVPLEAALRDSAYERLQPLLNAAEQIGEIYALYLSDNRGRVRLKTTGAAEIVDESLVREAYRRDRNEEQFASVDGVPMYVLYLPLHASELEVPAVLVVARSLHSLQDELEQLEKSILVAVLLLLAMVLLGSFILIRQAVTLPVNSLVQAVREIGGGNFLYRVRLPRGAGREMVELAAAIEHMGRRLEEEHRNLDAETARRVELEARLRQADKLATLGQVAAGLAHEIGTPLNIIGGRADMALKKLHDPVKLEEYLSTIRQQVDRIAETVQRLLNVARRQERRRARLRLVDVLREAVALLDPTAQKAGVKLRFQAISRGEVVGDAELLQQVFTNLILNAIQASPLGGTIEILLQPVQAAPAGLDLLARPYVEVSIADEGPGIPLELRAKVFEPFFTTKPPGSGTGLGLAICAGIVKEHEGFIRIGDSPSGGAKVSVYLPADVPVSAQTVKI